MVFLYFLKKQFSNYKCSKYYSKTDERAILFNDLDLNVDWKVTNPIVSAKDKLAKIFKDIEKDFIYSIS